MINIYGIINILSLVGCCIASGCDSASADGSHDASATSTPSESVVTDSCNDLCSYEFECGLRADDCSAVCSFPGTYADLRVLQAAVLEQLGACLAAAACDTEDDSSHFDACRDAVGTNVLATADPTLSASCFDRRRECGETVIAESSCNVVGLYSEAGLELSEACLTKACDDVDACLTAISRIY